MYINSLIKYTPIFNYMAVAVELVLDQVNLFIEVVILLTNNTWYKPYK